MYEHFYHLSSDPFRLLPDPGICFTHSSSAKAWAYLRYALKRGEGIVVVTGPPGSGKTTLAQRLISEINPAKVTSVRLVANDLSATDLLRKLAYNLGLPVEGKDRAMLTLMLERHLAEVELSQRRILVVIDEGQTLSHQALDAMRLLTDYQSRTRPVLQLVLFGQEELEGIMGAPGMEQFQQRVIASCRLQPMDLTETKSYLEYRLAAADWRGDPSINGPAVMAVYRYSRGVPRHVNKIFSRLLLHGSSEEKHALTERDVMDVVSDLRSESLAPANREIALEATPSSALSSIYELALVPSTTQRRSADVAAATLGSHVSEVAGRPAALDSSTGRAGQPTSYRSGYGGDRYMFRVGQRYETGLRRRLFRSLRRWRSRALRLIGDALSNGSGGAAGLGLLLRRAIGYLRGVLRGAPARLQSLREWLGDVARRPLFGQPAGMFASGVAAIVLVGIIVAAMVPDDGAGVHDEDQMAGDVSADDEAAGLDNGVLASPEGYVRLGDARPEQDGVRFGDDSLSMPGVGGGRGDRASQLNQLVGIDTGIDRLQGNDDARRAVDGDQLLNRITEDTTRNLLSAAGRYDSSLILWSLARPPASVSEEGVTVWSTKQDTDAPQIVPGFAIRVPDNDIADDALRDDVATPAESSDRVEADVSLAAQVASETDQAALQEGTESTGAGAVDVSVSVTVAQAAGAGDAAAPPAAVETAPVGDGDSEPVDVVPPTLVMVPDRVDVASDFTRYLPATSAGAVETQIVGAPPALDIEEAVVAATDRDETATVDSQPAVDSATVAVPEEPVVSAVVTPSADADAQAVEVDAADAAEARRNDEIAELIERANRAIAANRLLIPERSSAYTYLRRAAELDADNPDVQRGLERIVGRYARLATEAIGQEAYDKADLYVDRGLRVLPGSVAMRDVRREVDAARAEAEAVAIAEAEAEMARLAAAEVKPPEPVAPPPKKSSFGELMRWVEGI